MKTKKILTMTNEHKLLQLFYAGVLADSVKNYDKAGILETVTASKFLQQQKAVPAQLKQLEINTVSDLFCKYSQIFGCIDWEVTSRDDGYTARGGKCLLCNIAKNMGTAQPCEIYCINPVKASLNSISPGYRLEVDDTLWHGKRCEFSIYMK